MDEQQRKLAEELLFSSAVQGGFAKGLYLGAANLEKIFPFPKLSASEQAEEDKYIKKIEEFADTHIDADLIDRQASIPDDVIQGLGQLGVLGMTIPKEYGGLGMSQHAYCRTVEAISRRCGATALFINAHQSVGLKALLLFGTEAQKKKWLPPLARGEHLAAFSLTEPNAGSDAAGIQTRAVYDSEKKVWRINGKKQWTTNGAFAEVLTVMARTEIDTPQGKQDKITAFLVTPSMPGFKVLAASLEKVGMRGSKTANLEFINVEVPEENVLGPLGGGLKVCLTVLDYGRTTFGAMCTGSAKFLVEKAIAHATTRHQFNRPLSSFALVKKKIALMSAYVYAMEASTYLTAGLIDQHIEDIMLESAILKVFVSDSLWNILYDTMQIYGGRSFFTDQPFERMMRDARLNMIGEGSNEVMRAFIGAVGLRDVGVKLQATLDSFLNPFAKFSTLQKSSLHWISRLKTPQVSVRSPELQAAATLLGKKIKAFGIAAVKLLVRYREGIIEEQLQLDRMANCAMALYTSAASLSYLDSDLQEDPQKKDLKKDISLVKLYCQMAFQTIDQQLTDMSHNLDDQLIALADQLTGKNNDADIKC